MDTNSTFLISTPRLTLREITIEDADALFELDSDSLVCKYLGNNPLTSKEQSVEIVDFIRKQYKENGTGRLAVIENNTNLFVGWCGLKLFTQEMNGHTNFLDIGYRFIPKYWGKGYATEAAKASVENGFKVFNHKAIYGMADANNAASIRVLEKCGLKSNGMFNFEDTPHVWMEIHKAMEKGL